MTNPIHCPNIISSRQEGKQNMTWLGFLKMDYHLSHEWTMILHSKVGSKSAWIHLNLPCNIVPGDSHLKVSSLSQIYVANRPTMSVLYFFEKMAEFSS